MFSRRGDVFRQLGFVKVLVCLASTPITHVSPCPQYTALLRSASNGTVLLKRVDVHSHRTAMHLPKHRRHLVPHVNFPLAPPDCPWAAYSGATSSPACEELQPNQPSATTESSLDAPYDIVENLKDLTTAAS